MADQKERERFTGIPLIRDNRRPTYRREQDEIHERVKSTEDKWERWRQEKKRRQGG